MGKLGFYCFTSPEMPVPLTLRQQVVALSNEQRKALLTGFEQKIPASHLDHKLGLSKELIQYVYDGIDTIQERCRSYMRSEVIATPADIDTETGEVITPAVMNIQPVTQNSLIVDYIRSEYVDDYPANFVTLIVQEMVKWCKYDGTGNFNFYKNNITL